MANNFKAGNVLVAEYQSAGRGRLDRKFEVPPRKGLTFSFCLDAQAELGWIPLITGLAVSNAINKYLNQNLTNVKWPNDLLVDGKKLAGILSEKNSFGVVVGVGINIFQAREELPIDNAVSLAMFGEIDRTELLIEILNELGNTLSNIAIHKNEYRSKCATLGKTVRATLPNGEVIEDMAIAISEEGALLLKNREISVGDILHLR